MNRPARFPEPVTDRLHPLILLAVVVLLFWFVGAAWLLFSGPGYIELILTMVSVLMSMAIVIPIILWRANIAAHFSNARPNTPKALENWLRGRFATWMDEESGAMAAIEILLPIAAVAFAFTAMGIAFDLVRAGLV